MATVGVGRSFRMNLSESLIKGRLIMPCLTFLRKARFDASAGGCTIKGNLSGAIRWIRLPDYPQHNGASSFQRVRSGVV